MRSSKLKTISTFCDHNMDGHHIHVYKSLVIYEYPLLSVSMTVPNSTISAAAPFDSVLCRVTVLLWLLSLVIRRFWRINEKFLQLSGCE